MDKNIIGTDAGIVWRLLDKDNRKWNFKELKKATGFNDAQLGAAIGWLAREDKVEFELEEHNPDKEAYIYLIPNVYIG